MKYIPNYICQGIREWKCPCAYTHDKCHEQQELDHDIIDNIIKESKLKFLSLPINHSEYPMREDEEVKKIIIEKIINQKILGAGKIDPK